MLPAAISSHCCCCCKAFLHSALLHCVHSQYSVFSLLCSLCTKYIVMHSLCTFALCAVYLSAGCCLACAPTGRADLLIDKTGPFIRARHLPGTMISRRACEKTVLHINCTFYSGRICPFSHFCMSYDMDLIFFGWHILTRSRVWTSFLFCNLLSNICLTRLT